MTSPTPTSRTEASITWVEDGQTQVARWRSESGQPVPRRVTVADDRMRADEAFRLASEGTALLWRGDFHNARQLLQAMARRIDQRARRSRPPADFPEAFHLHRQARAQRARTLGMLLLPFEPGHVLPLRRAPDVKAACEAVYGAAPEPYVTSLRELQGLIGAWQWHEKGVPIAPLGARIHPCYGVYSPVRGEYLDLIARAPLPQAASAASAGAAPFTALDIGTGTGVIAALLARRGVARVIATDQDPRALDCARENVQRLGLEHCVTVMQADLFPLPQSGTVPALLAVCNPPWVPARPAAPVEHAVYDPESRMLRGFLDGLRDHLAPHGEGWLILSDLAEHLRLRSREQLLGWIDAAGLAVASRLDARPQHPKAGDATDPLHAARRAEVTSLWRLRLK